MVGATRAAVPLRGPSAIVPLVLFAASAVFTLWRNAEVGVLVDFAYIVNIATRIAAGDVPYAQFPLAQAPLAFLTQAALIKLAGPHYAVQIGYVVIVGGIATALTYTIARRILEGSVRSPTALAAILCIPIIPLGIYAIFPHPFYDPDACLFVLAAIGATLAARDRPSRRRWVVSGALLAIPIFVKQNIGGAFLVAVLAALAADAIAWPAARRDLRWCLAGLAGALAVALVGLQLVIGIDHYVAWAWTFALSGRGVTAQRIAAFADASLLWPGVLVLVVALASRRLAPRSRAALFVAAGAAAVAAMAAGASATAASAGAPLFLVFAPALFPPVMIAAVILAVVRAAREGPRFETLLPLVLLATTLGVLQSQGLSSSSFGIFPLLVLGLAALIRELAWAVPSPERIASLTGVAFGVILAVSGTLYTVTNRSLLFVDVNAPGPVAHAAFPSLAGLSARGPYLADLDEILVWTRDHVPPDDGVVFLPGEDPVFFALGRRPRLPSVYFYDVATPYSPAELARIADETDLRWVFVKDRLQLVQEPPLEQSLVAALTERATLVARVGVYRVYRR